MVPTIVQVTKEIRAGHKPEPAIDDFVDPDFDQELLNGLVLSGFEDKSNKQLLTAAHLLRKSGLHSLRPLLPLLLSLKGDPYTLEKHFPFEPFFRTRMPRQLLLKCARQTSKSTSIAAGGIIHCNSAPWYSILFIGPLFETIRRFSQNYVRPFIETSPVRGLFSGKSTINSVLQRSFKNHSQMLFSFAFLDAERTRGISADECNFDEVQMLDKSFIPIIEETMSGSKLGGIKRFAGTPLGLENTIEGLWTDSSQAEWCIRCIHGACNAWNIPSMHHHIDAMLGPWHDNISETHPAVICHKCRRPLYPQLGHWVHAYPERRWDFAGYHVPQIILPMHYGKKDKWGVLLAKRAGRGNTRTNVFFNEVLAESYDTGSRIVTMTDLQAACILPWENKMEEACKHLKEYPFRVLACDWGGGGKDGVSFTCLAVLGMRPDGKIDVIWGLRSLEPHNHEKEANLCLAAMNVFKCQVMAHDYTGAGSTRETIVVQAGFPLERIMPIAYVRAAAGDILQPIEATEQHPRDHWQVDKARSLLLTCQQIKNKWVRFFKWDRISSDDTGLISDFLALVDEKVDSRTGRELFTIIRDPNMHDDFAQAVNMGCCALWNMSNKWPDIAEIAGLRVDPKLLAALHPPSSYNWEDMLSGY